MELLYLCCDNLCEIVAVTPQVSWEVERIWLYTWHLSGERNRRLIIPTLCENRGDASVAARALVKSYKLPAQD